MKIFLVILLIHNLVFCVSAQTSSHPDLANTKWQGRVERPQSRDIILEFRKDSVIATAADGAELEVMFFSQSKDTLKLKKLNGQSPCDDITVGIYRVEWNDNAEKVTLHIVSDECKARSASITSAGAYFRVKK
jgi:hypothetical protein